MELIPRGKPGGGDIAGQEYMSETNYFSLLQVSAVQEMTNIGLGSAATALSQLTGHSFNMEVPKVQAVPVEDIPFLIDMGDQPVVGLYTPIYGDVDGHIAFLFPWESAVYLWKCIVGTSPADMSEIDEMAASVMMEVGNIINSSFLNAIADMTGSTIHICPPCVSIDISVSITSSIAVQAEAMESTALAVETKIFASDDHSISGCFLCIPSAHGLNLLFERLGIGEAA